jgi:hypothetical protein
MHLYRVQLPYADLFVEKLDFDNQLIKYTVRTTDGKLQEPEREEKFIVTAGKVSFGSRFLSLDMALQIAQTLHG